MMYQFVRILDSSKADLLAAFHPAHCLDYAAQFVLLGKRQPHVCIDTRASRYLLDVLACIVLASGSPSRYDLRNRVEWWPLLHVVPYDDEACPQAHFHCLELLESFVRLRLAFALPIIALAYVQRVVVADSPRGL